MAFLLYRRFIVRISTSIFCMTSEISQIYQCAQSLGFDLVGISDSIIPTQDHDAFLQWLEQNHHGTMHYLARDPERRCIPSQILPNAQSVIMVALNYGQTQPDSALVKMGKYARGKPDYHLVFEQKLSELCEILNTTFKNEAYRFSVDYGPLMERSFASKAQLGFIGKNTTLITREFGSWVLLGEIITTAKLPSSPLLAHGRCGTCTKCITSCPTGALTAEYKLDSRLCISYLTIENKGPIPVELREKVGAWLFGCDICQDVCPHNTKAKAYVPSKWTTIAIAPDLSDPDYLSSTAFLIKILTIPDQEEFKQFFKNTPFLRAKRVGMIRNACVVAGNLNDKSLIPYLEPLLKDESALIREHADWAIKKLRPDD